MPRLSPIGIDVGNSAVKVAQLCYRDGQWLPMGIGRGDLPPKEPGAAASSADWIAAIHEAISAGGVKGKRVVVTAPCDYIDVRPITVPVAEGIDLDSYVRSELAERVTHETADFVSDYWIGGEVVEHGETKLQVYSVSAPKDQIVSLIRTVEQAGLICTRIEIQATSLGMCMSRSANDVPGERPLILDIGSRHSMLLALGNDGISFCRTIGWGSERVTCRIREELNVDFESAERIKKESGLVPTGTTDDAEAGDAPRQQLVNDCIEQELRGLALEIGRSLAYRARSGQEREATSLCVVGGGSSLKGLDRFIHDALKLKVTHPSILGGVDQWHDMARTRLNDESPAEYAVALGTALAGVNEG